jgi:hypothetical protein
MNWFELYHNHTMLRGICPWARVNPCRQAENIVASSKYIWECYVKIFLKMCAVPRMTYFCSSTLHCLPEMSSKTKCFGNVRHNLSVEFEDECDTDKLSISLLLSHSIIIDYRYHFCLQIPLLSITFAFTLHYYYYYYFTLPLRFK